jgi:hypothetical protein
VATVRLLLAPLWTADVPDCAFLFRAPGQGQATRASSPTLSLVADGSRFLLETVDGLGDGALSAALKAQPFRGGHLGKEGADGAAAAQHASLRSSSRGGAALYEVDPRSFLGLPPLPPPTPASASASKSSASLRRAAPAPAATAHPSALPSAGGGSVAVDLGSGGLACALTLLAAGSRPSAPNDAGGSALHVAAAAPELLASLRALLELNGGADVDAQVAR